MMQRFWSVLAVTLGKRAGLVSVICLGVTLVLGIGITQLEFATGQDSYLNKDDQVAKDNVTYQDLFGGQAMLTVITMDEGHTVDELFTPENRAQLQQFHDDLLATKTVHGVITPLTIRSAWRRPTMPMRRPDPFLPARSRPARGPPPRSG